VEIIPLCENRKFISYNSLTVTEAEAAKEAGLRVILMEREGNEPLVEDIRSAFTIMKVFPTEVPEESASKKAKLEEKEEVADVEMKEEAESATEKPAEEQKVEVCMLLTNFFLTNEEMFWTSMGINP
jgi:hypothetical protein